MRGAWAGSMAILVGCMGAPDADTSARPDPPGDVEEDTGVAVPEVGPWAVLVDATRRTGIEGPRAEVAPADMLCPRPTHMGGAVAIEDVDGDGWVDVLLARHRLPTQLWRNQGDGTFVDVAGEVGLDDVTTATAAAWGDVDGDGDLDLFVAVGGLDASRLYVQGPEGFVDEADRRGAAIEVDPADDMPCGRQFAVVFGDPDHDGDLDLFVGQWGAVHASSAALLLNDGDGYFVDGTADAGLSLRGVHTFSAAFIDLDADGWEDLVLTADFGTSRVFRNTQDGRFADVTARLGVGTEEDGMGHVWADLDRDGDIDGFVTSIHQDAETCLERYGWGCSGNRAWRNDGGRFTDVTDAWGLREGGWGWGTAAADLDLDGQVELLQTNGWWPLDNPDSTSHVPFHDDPNRLWWRGPSGAWVERSAAAGFRDVGLGRGLVAADLDGDGDPDVVQTFAVDPPRVWRTERRAGSHWLAVRAPGVDSNALGVGAVVEVLGADGVAAIDVVDGDPGFAGHGPYEARFGLGATREVAMVRVRWPATGRQRVLTGVAADQVLVVEEPAARAYSSSP